MTAPQHRLVKMSIVTLIVAILGTLAWLLISKSGTESFTICELLNEESCRQSPVCGGEYGPSFCGGGICTMDITYKGCSPLSEEDVQRMQEYKNQTQTLIEKSKLECESVEGAYYENLRCECENGVNYYEKNNCNTLKTVCAAEGGVFFEAGKYSCDRAQYSERGKYSCPRVLPPHKREPEEACECPDGELWSPQFGCQN